MARPAIWVLLAFLGSGAAASETEREVHELTPRNLQAFAARHRKALVLMYEGSCTMTMAFQPWIFALAQMLPTIAMAQLDVSSDNGEMIKSVFNLTKFPQIKLFAKDKSKGERVIDYQGPLEFDSLYDWSTAVRAGQDHELSSFGTEPAEGPAAGGGDGSSPVNAFAKLPPEVRNMATTMVREGRLQKILKQQGGGRIEAYDQKVSQRYKQIMKDERTALSDKFGVQEANRRARDEVREELLASAPDHIREEIESEITMGDIAKGHKL